MRCPYSSSIIPIYSLFVSQSNTIKPFPSIFLIRDDRKRQQTLNAWSECKNEEVPKTEGALAMVPTLWRTFWWNGMHSIDDGLGTDRNGGQYHRDSSIGRRADDSKRAMFISLWFPCDVCLCVVACYASIERVKMQESRGRQPETFMLFDSREVPYSDDNRLCNPPEQGAVAQYALKFRTAIRFDCFRYGP